VAGTPSQRALPGAGVQRASSRSRSPSRRSWCSAVWTAAASVCGAAVALHSQPLELPWLREFLSTQLGDGARPHLVLRIGLVAQVAVSVRRDPGDVLFPAGDDRAGLGPG